MWWHTLEVDLWEEFVRVSTGERPSRPDRAPHPETIGRTRLPALPGLRERVRTLHGVLEVLTAEEYASPGHLEAYFTTKDELAAEAFIARLHEMAGPTA
ncbi:hypothetical protein ACMA1D_14050, partial [Streptomyces sp. 796.1]|uniref:hypothetical protein n=1 Tax=Streptomyces sp. 796.1 TaxID=3163029 RepID=UPI0039C8C3D6